VADPTRDRNGAEPTRFSAAIASPRAKVATLGASLLLTSIAVVVYLLAAPLIGLGIIVVTAIAMVFVLTDRDTTTVLTAFVVLLLGIPSRFVLGPLGELGTPAKLVGVAALVWWLATRCDRNLGADHGPQPVRQVLFIYLWWSALTYALAFLRPLDPVEVSSATRALLSLVALGGIALLAADGIPTRQRLEVLIQRMVTMTGIVAVIGIGQYFYVDIVPYLRFPGLVANLDLESVAVRSDFARVAGTAVHAIEFGVILALVAPFAVHQIMHARRRHASAWFWCAAIFAAIPTAVSRSAVVTLALTMGVLALRWTWSQRIWAGLLALVGMVLARAVAPGLLGTLRSLFLWWGQDDSISGRTEDFGPVYNYISESPWVGRGLGTFEPSVYFFLDNEWLMAGLTTGIPGILALLALFGVGMGCARGIVRRAELPETAHLGQAFLAAFVGAAVAFGTFDGLSFNITAGTLFLLLGLVGALWRLEVGSVQRGRDEEGRLPTRPRRGPTAAPTSPSRSGVPS
jgi:polysaccharide biosynthesis protein PslJ